MAIELDHPFTTDKPIDESYATILDLERAVPCVEGGTVIERTGPDSVKAEIKVKMGAMSMKFTGTLEIVEQDPAAHRVVMRVKSKEAGGQGHANADVTFTLATAGATSTRRADHRQGRVDGRGGRRGRAGRADHGLRREARRAVTRRGSPHEGRHRAGRPSGSRAATASRSPPSSAIKRSAPRPPGSKMAINDRGEVYGAVSGGCVEGAVVEVAERGAGGRASPQLVHYGIADSDAWDVGLPCGGEIDVWVERYEP